MANKFTYQCNDCGKQIPAGGIVYVCPDCSAKQQPDQPPMGILKIVYNPDYIKTRTFIDLKENQFLDLLPLNNLQSLPFLKTGNTPLYRISKLNGAGLKHTLLLKDDSQNPTFSFKDRASAVVSAFAKENGIGTIVAASTGNAGSSLAGMCAAQGQKAVIFVPAAAPKAKLTQILMYGATLVPVDGNYDMAFDLSIEATRRFGWYNRNTAYNPLTIEGKKTVSFELYIQLNQHLPDRIFVPVGDGVIISGVYKGFEDLLNHGIIDRMPVIVAVQAEGSSNIVDNLGKSVFRANASHTIADSISVDIPRNFRMAADYLMKYKGETVKVSDKEILQASASLAGNTGIFSEPAAAAAFAGYQSFARNNQLPAGSSNVVLLTGSGLKDLNAVQPMLEIPAAVKPGMASVEAFLKGKI
ncbi:MAG: threonine synthase [Bacteroidales bacterium]|nr:threonine synthase [Bacteroidales bacterium]